MEKRGLDQVAAEMLIVVNELTRIKQLGSYATVQEVEAQKELRKMLKSLEKEIKLYQPKLL